MVSYDKNKNVDEHSKLFKTLPYLPLAFGVLTAFTGAAFTVLYIIEAVIARAGEPDQSLLFWYLPVLYLGLIGMLIGTVMVVWGVSRLRMARLHVPPGDVQRGGTADSQGRN